MHTKFSSILTQTLGHHDPQWMKSSEKEAGMPIILSAWAQATARPSNFLDNPRGSKGPVGLQVLVWV